MGVLKKAHLHTHWFSRAFPPEKFCFTHLDNTNEIKRDVFYIGHETVGLAPAGKLAR